MNVDKPKLGWYVIKQIAKNSNLPKPTKVLGQGMNGIVFNTNRGTLLKFIYGNHPREYKALEKLKNTKIVPMVYKSRVVTVPNKKEMEILKRGFDFNSSKQTNKLTIFEMNKLNAVTLYDYITKIKKRMSLKEIEHLKTMILYAAKQMWRRGVIHGDLHIKNIMVSYDASKNITKVWFIDFGRSRTCSNTWNPRTIYMRTMIPSLFSKTKTRVPVYGPNGSRKNDNMLHAEFNIRVPKKIRAQL